MRRASQLPPLRTCGECGKRWRTWDTGKRCNQCVRRSAVAQGLLPASGQLRELPGETWEDIFFPPPAAA